RLCVGKRNFEAMAGDLFEEYTSATHSAWWFWKQVFSTFPHRFHSSPRLVVNLRRPRLNPLDSIFADIRYAMRTLRRTPSLTAAILLATALGIGVNTGILFADECLGPAPFAGKGCRAGHQHLPGLPSHPGPARLWNSQPVLAIRVRGIP